LAEPLEASKNTLAQPNIKQKILNLSQSLGFSDCRIASATKLEEYNKHYSEFIAQNRHGEMTYLQKHAPLKTNPQLIQAGAKSIIMLSINYFQARRDLEKQWQTQIHLPAHKEGQVARYAFGRDYHKVFKSKLKQLAKLLNQNFPDSQTRFFADSGPLLERQYAEFSGLGYIGKNCLLITRSHGSWVLLGELITTLDIPADQPFDRQSMQCGSCNRCQVACPTGALDQDYKMDASKCISYLTIEHKGIIPEELRPKIGNWIFGCDICQEICPHNIRAKQTTLPDFSTAIAGNDLNLQEILEIPDEQAFLARFAGSPLMRAKRTKLLRNACIVAANLKRQDLLPQIQKLCLDPDPIIAHHARWAQHILSE
jgi:epoxyqueuosine reductase